MRQHKKNKRAIFSKAILIENRTKEVPTYLQVGAFLMHIPRHS